MADAGDNQRRSDEKESISTEETKVNKKLNKNLPCSLTMDCFEKNRVDKRISQEKEDEDENPQDQIQSKGSFKSLREPYDRSTVFYL